MPNFQHARRYSSEYKLQTLHRPWFVCPSRVDTFDSTQKRWHSFLTPFTGSCKIRYAIIVNHNTVYLLLSVAKRKRIKCSVSLIPVPLKVVRFQELREATVERLLQLEYAYEELAENKKRQSVRLEKWERLLII